MALRIFSGIQPTGKLHLGNYLGAVSNWVTHQSDAYYSIVDMHAISTLYFEKQDSRKIAKELEKSILSTAAYLYASGVQEENLSVQSAIPEHAELMWILSSISPMHWFQRMTQFKVKKEKLNGASLGLFAYPALMTADILLYRANQVPVGDDQVQHLELARNVAIRFNGRFETDLFPIPQAMHSPSSRIMSLKNPQVKMSKSGDSDAARINLEDTDEMIIQKISKAKTDSLGPVTLQDENRPELNNLMRIYTAVSGKAEADLVGLSMQELKRELTESLVSKIKPIRDRANEYLADQDTLIKALEIGNDRARSVANETIAEVRSLIGYYKYK